MQYEKECVPLIIYVPENTVKLNITATVMETDDSLVEVKNIMNVSEVIAARLDGEEWESDNVTYYLTEEGKELVTNL